MHGSGDFVIGFSTAYRIEHAPSSLTGTRTVLADEPKAMASLFPAVAECVEEAILNSLFRAETIVGRDGNACAQLPAEEVMALVRRTRRE
jgi:D-aminopeptidase